METEKNMFNPNDIKMFEGVNSKKSLRYDVKVIFEEISVF